jgi:hypothetical protein
MNSDVHIRADAGGDASAGAGTCGGCPTVIRYAICAQPKANASLLAEAVAAAKGAAQVVLVINLQSKAPCDTDQAYKDGGNEFNSCACLCIRLCCCSG